MDTRALIKFVFWLAVAIAVFWYGAQFYTSGEMTHWYYFKATTDGYAINDNTFKEATKDKPVYLTIATGAEEVSGAVAVPVKKGQELPRGANGVISATEVQSGKRVALESDKLKMMVPYQIKESKGFNYRDTFKHKGIETNPWSGAWNLAMVLALGLSLGLMAEGFTDAMGLKYKKIQHFEATH